ncbi:MAG: PHP domain-containing protein [Spirochaetota bacterium]
MPHIIADLHNHSCLSPCGSLENSPQALVKRAKEAGIDMVALTDHNCARNLPAFEISCRKNGLTAVYGLEVTTQEEVHVVCLFETLRQATDFGLFIEDKLPEIPNIPDIFGDQVYVDANENVLGFLEKSLLSGTTLSFDHLVQEVLSRDGLVIPAHIDRMAFGAVAQLGFLPDLPYSAVEVVHPPSPYETYDNTIITNSDAHHLKSVGQRTFSFEAGESPFSALRTALQENRVQLNRRQ